MLSGQHNGLRRVVWPWPLNIWPENQEGPFTHWEQPLHQVWYWSSDGVKSYWADNTVGWEEWFDLDLWTCDLKIARDHLLIQGNPCTKFGIDQVKRSKNIERKTQWAEKSGLTLTFEHLTWKSIGIIYLLRATPAPSLVLIKWRGQKILSGQHLVFRPIDRPTYWPTDSCKTICPLFQGGQEKKPYCSSHPSEFVVFHGGDCETVAVVGGESQSSGVALMMPGAGF